VRAAYEKLQSLDTRLRYRLFEAGKRENIDAIVEEITCRSPRPRTSLRLMLDVLRKP
jgi:hypothetical protein